MFPTAFEFRWDAGHMIFFGVFYSVVIVVLTSLLFVTAKSVSEVYRNMKSNSGGNGEITPDVELPEKELEGSVKK